MAEKIISQGIEKVGNAIVLSEKMLFDSDLSSARVTNACLIADVNVSDENPIKVDVQYNRQTPQIIDLISPKKGDKISINITEELNCLIKFAFQYSGNPEHDDKIAVIFNSDKLKLSGVKLFVEYIPAQIMHENNAYVDFDARSAGGGQVNLATGLTKFKHQCGNEVGLVYNSWQAAKRTTTILDAQSKKKVYQHGVGNGFKLNAEQFLVKRIGTDEQTVYTYIDGDGNYHEFTEKYYYLDKNNKKVFVSRADVIVAPDGKLSFAKSKNNVEIKVERKSTTNLVLEQDYTHFKHGKYLEQRQQEQIELEENVEALARQLKEYVVIEKATGKNNVNTNELKNYFNKKGELSLANYENFIKLLDSSKLLLTSSEAIQYTSLLLQQTTHKKALEEGLEISNSSYNPKTYYSDRDNQTDNAFRNRKYDRKLINLRKLVSDLKEDYARLIKKSNYIKGNSGLNYQYDAYMEYLRKEKCNFKDKCSANIEGAGCEENLINKKTYEQAANNLSITLEHLEGDYCDLQAELEQINDDLDHYYRKIADSAVQGEKERQKVLEQHLRVFQKKFSNRTDKLQQNINKFETEINKFIERKQRELTNRQIALLVERSATNKIDLEKYFKQFYNYKRQLTQMYWQFPTSFITGNEGVTMGFNKDGYLVALFDNYENQTAIIYEKGRISAIRDTDNNVTTFEYGKNKRIKKIVTSDSKTYQLFYGGERGQEGLLTKIVDGNGEETKLGYDTYGFLNSVEDAHGFGVKLTYDKYGRVEKVNQTTRVSSVADNEVITSAQQTKLLASIDYNETHLTTSVTNHLDVTTTYNFDIMGKVVTMYEGKYSDPERSTRAKSFEYVDGKKSFTISDNLFGEDLLQDVDDVTLYGADMQGTARKHPTGGFATSKYAIKKPSLQLQSSKTIDVAIPESDATDYVFSVWANADSAYVESARSSLYINNKINEIYGITNDANKQNRKFEVRAQISYADGTEENFVANFDWLITKWQYVAMPIEIKRDKKLTSCKITLDYSYNVGTAKFSCMSLRQGTWSYSEFDEEGKQTYSEDSTTKTHTQYFYDDDDKLIKEVLTDRQGRTFESKYEYNAQSVLVRSISYNGTVTEHVFDEKGRETKQIVYNLEDPTSKLYTESKRDDKGVVTADVDQSGLYNSAEYTYDHQGTNTVVTDGKGNQTAYGYKDGQLVSISGSSDGEESVNKQSITANLLTKVTNGETEFHYSYDGRGRTTQIEIANEVYATTKYVDDYTTETTLANGDICHTVNDKYGNTTEQTVTRAKIVQKVTNTYHKETQQLLQSAVDIDGKKTYNVSYEYDAKGNVVKEQKGGEYALLKKHTYTKDNDLQATEYTVDKQTLKYEFETDHTPDKRSAKVVLPFGTEQKLAYDGLGRTKEIALGSNLVKDVFYAKYGDHATDRVSSVWHGVNGIRKENTRYTYDKAGNIETVTENGKLVARYAYDGLNRLVREDNVHFGTSTYQYDHAGNILRKTSCAFTLDETLTAQGTDVEYEYAQNGWKDQLVLFNGEDKKDGKGYQYDQLGNPTTYRGYDLTWQGRRLVQFDGVEYTYDADGIRTSKRDDNKTIKFFTDKNQIVAEQLVVNGSIKGSRYYIYGADGIAGFRQGKETYLFRKNIQGDVTHIYKLQENKPLELQAQYVYDAWGNCKVLNSDGVEVDFEKNRNFIGHTNPFRYRGYYFDYETGFYYLQTRYYDPQTGRFISADSIEYLDPETLGGLNLYAYCGNNPVMATDETGTMPNWLKWLIGAVIIVGLGVATVFTGGAAGVILGAAFYGAVTSAVGGALVGGILGGITGGWQGFLDGAASGFMSGAITGAITGALLSGLNIATGGVQIVGSAQKTGSLFHQFASNVQAGKMSLAIGRYSEIHLNRSKGLGIRGFRPDVTGVTKNGLRVVEVVSSSQTYASQVAKVERMMAQYSHITNGLTLDFWRFITKWFVF